MAHECSFCEIAAGPAPAVVVWEDEHAMALVDLRQANPGHTLVIPRRHVADLRDLEPDLGDDNCEGPVSPGHPP